MKYLWLACFVLLHLEAIHFRGGQGYSGGSPDQQGVCVSLLPSHDGSPPQTTDIPYDVTVSGTPNDGSYDATENHTVTISGKSGSVFMGFLVQARQYTGDQYETIGDFETASNTKVTCQTNGGSSITQSEASSKSTVSVTWIAPPNVTGTVRFMGSVVMTEHEFWQFPPVQSSETNGTTPEPGEPPFQIDTSECGTRKGCYLSGCEDPNSADKCNFGVTWSEAAPDGTAFELFASTTSMTTPYVALGLSSDTQMGGDSVTDCIYNPSDASVIVQMSWNPGESNTVLGDKYLSLVNGSVSGYLVNGMLVCRFTRLTYPPPGQTPPDIFYPGSELYHILFAKGLLVSGTPYKDMHSAHAASADKVNFTLFLVASGDQGLSAIVKAHGIMMIFGWMVFASFGMLLPRYYKSAWPGKKIGGKAIWFQLHQLLMCLTFLLTTVAFIIIFVEVGGYSNLDAPAIAHPPLGIIATALVLINPIMAAFRPDPGTKHRPMFNYCHFAVGLVSHLSATITLFLAMYISSLQLPEWCLWVMVGYICWHACIEITLAVHMHYSQHRSKKKQKANEASNDDPSRMYEVPETRPSSVETYSLFRTALGVLHLVGVVGCSIALSVQIGIS